MTFLTNIWQNFFSTHNVNICKIFTNILKTILINQEIILVLLSNTILLILKSNFKKQYYNFLHKTSKKIGKIDQDNISYTLYNILWSMLISLPICTILALVGHHLNKYQNSSIEIAIGDGIFTIIPILYVLILITYLSHPQGLFIIHFQWNQSIIKNIINYCKLSIKTIIPLIIIIIVTLNHNNSKFVDIIGKTCFVILCLSLSWIINHFKTYVFSLNTNALKSNSYIANHCFCNLIICVLISAIIFATLGYLKISKILIFKLEISAIIWILSLITYNVIKRWIFIQGSYFISKQNKFNNNFSLITNNNHETNLINLQIKKILDVTENNNIRKISNQSLQLTKLMICISALLSIIKIWPELNCAFKFLEKITLWDVTSSINGIYDLQPITLGSLLISISIFIITIKIIRNLPALLELVLLPHLNLTPGTGYAITTLAKYSLMLTSGLISFSFIGIEWSKLQWLIAALGVGLGFGLQEIFANFISGLIILFEKPVRIGDTVTIKNFTGNISKINTRATTLTDWDHKDIIIPNKEFITEKFINWSLTDTITRVVLKIPAPAEANIDHIIHILITSVKNCPLVLNHPEPEIYLIDLQQGLPIFEIRLYAAEVKHRMRIRHQVHILILSNYKKHGLELPSPPLQINRKQNKKHNFYDKYFNNK